MARLKEYYRENVAGTLKEKMGYKNVMEIPRLEKIIVNMGIGEAALNPKALDGAVQDLQTISGQKPIVTKAKKSIASFKLREGMSIGCKVTLRGNMMYEFLDRLVNATLPRVRDFRGVSAKAFDGRGNYTLGLKEQIIFPEINYDRIDKIRGFDMTICTSANNDRDALALLKALRFPFTS